MGDVDLTARIDSETHPGEGTVVEFGFDEEDLYRFDFDFDTAGSLETETGGIGVSYEQYVRPER